MSLVVLDMKLTVVNLELIWRAGFDEKYRLRPQIQIERLSSDGMLRSVEKGKAERTF